MADKELNNELTNVDEKAVAKKDSDSKKPEKKKGPGIGRKILNVFKDFKGEIKKITWPTPKQTLHNTLVVIGAMILMGVFVFLLDTAFSEVVELLAGMGK